MKDKKPEISGVALSVILIIIGLLLAVFPNGSAKVICTCIGIVLAVLGVLSLVTYFTKTMKVFRGNDLVTGILCIVAALLLFINPDAIISCLTIIFGIVLVADGAVKIQEYIAMKHAGITQNFSVLVIAGISLVLGMVMIFDPFTSKTALMVFAGISLIVDGVLDLLATYVFKTKKPVSEDKVIDLDDDDISVGGN